LSCASNFWLLESSANRSSGAKINNELNRKLDSLLALGRHVWSPNTVRSSAINARARDEITIQQHGASMRVAGHPQDHYTVDQINSGVHLDGLNVLNERQIRHFNLQGSPTRIVIFSNPNGGQRASIPWSEGQQQVELGRDPGWGFSGRNSAASIRVTQLNYQQAAGTTEGGTGTVTGFAYSENGDQAYLSSAQADTLTGYRVVEDFGASPRGASWGRYYKSSTDNYNFVPLDHNTPGRPNSYPAVGPIVINEIMYNPDWPHGGLYTNNQYEYIELHNITDQPILLYDDEVDEPWKFTDGIDYTFPGAPGIELPAGGYLVLAKNMTAYVARYGTPPFGTFLLGPYDGKLSDAGEKLQLSRPGDVDEFGQRCYIRADRVNYSDGSHAQDMPGKVDLWPTEPDGTGASLSRIAPDLYGNDPNNWKAGTPSPGAPNQ